MSDSVNKFVVQLIEKKTRLPKDIDIDKFNYVDTGYVDSLGIIKFIVEIESHFDIEITDTDIESPEFRTIGGIASIISNKISNRINND
jgi:D-alanine--poly(phosphoribitol) ligase subunit 2